MPNGASKLESPAKAPGVIAVSVDALQASVLGFDLYLRRNESDSLTLYRSRDFPLRQEDLKRLTRRGVTTLYIAGSDGQAYRQYAEQRILNSEDIPPAQKHRVMTDVYRAVFEGVFWQGETTEVIDFAQGVAEHVTKVICHSGLVLSDLFRLMNHDDCTYIHSISVCTYALILARKLGIQGSDELAGVARGSLLHDIGKRGIGVAVLEKPGRLTEEERTLVQTHPVFGLKELVPRDDIKWGELMMVYQHHERLDGKGYPVGLTHREIHPWARICSVADVFHALTSHRPYRSSLPQSKACEYLDRQAGVMLDEDMVKCWIATVKAGSVLQS